MTQRTTCLSIILSLFVIGCFANNLEDAKLLYLNGQYSEALTKFKAEYQKRPKDASINQWIGVCLYETDSINESQKYLEFANQRGIPEASRYLAKISASKYNFDEADTYFSRYKTLLTKAKKEMSSEASDDMRQIKDAKGMLSHVEKIVILDSIVVDKNSFFNAYKLSPDAGSIQEISDNKNSGLIAFMPQSGEQMVWGEPDSLGNYQIMTKTKLIDGNWEQPQELSTVINHNGNCSYPFIMPDGATLYYASNGEGSIGGYDIFITRKDADSGDFLQPQNLGMPYNSPFDDYMLVIDEVSRFGWWATDRNNIPGKVTIYVFIPNEIRQNYDSEDENIQNYAKITDYKSSWSGNDYSEYIEKIQNIGNAEVKPTIDFEFPVAPCTAYYHYSDFKNSKAAAEMKILVSKQQEFENEKSNLKDLRKQYYSSKKKELNNKILDSEKKIMNMRQEIYNLENQIRKLEKQK